MDARPNRAYPHKWMYRLAVAAVAVFLILTPKTSLGQDREDVEREAGPPTLPATAAGNQLMWVLKVVNGQEIGDLKDHFSDRFIQTRGDDTKVLLEGLRQEVFEGGKVIVNKVLDGERENDISAEVTSKESWRYLHVFLMVDEKDGKIRGLRFAPAGGVGRNVGNWKQFDNAMNRVPEGVSFGAYELVPVNPNVEGSPLTMRVLAENGADRRLNVGATGYLYVVGAAAEEVAGKRMGWDDKVALKPEWNSLPPGEMRAMEGEHALREFVLRVMDDSDNTAADHLLHHVGRDKVEAYLAKMHLAAERNQPFLSSREVFALKTGKDKEMLAKFGVAGVEERRGMLAKVAALPLTEDAAEEWTDPTEIERVGWFASATECCRVMMDLHRLTQKEGMEPLSEALESNRGVKLSQELWSRAWYKGGDEPGVLNMTWLLERDDGRLFVMSIGWNNPKGEVKEARLLDLALAAIRLLGEEGRKREPAPAPRPKVDPNAAN